MIRTATRVTTDRIKIRRVSLTLWVVDAVLRALLVPVIVLEIVVMLLEFVVNRLERFNWWFDRYWRALKIIKESQRTGKPARQVEYEFEARGYL